MNKKPIVGITIGDVNGVGPEIILKTILNDHVHKICKPVIYGSSEVLRFYSGIMGIRDAGINEIKHTDRYIEHQINVIDCIPGFKSVSPGKLTPEAGELALKVLERAVTDIKLGYMNALVTAPLNKSNVAIHRPNFYGHTDFLAQADNNRALMILFAEKMRVVMVTGHIPLGKVGDAITKEGIFEKIQDLIKALGFDFGIGNPNIAVLGLNPHAGDNGLLGQEESEVIEPAIKQAQESGNKVFGPFPADGFFGQGANRNFDAILAMYHDQALIPFKTRYFNKGVNFTAGLSFVRTSPDHGTAFDIAGKNMANESSFLEAILSACSILDRRRKSSVEIPTGDQ